MNWETSPSSLYSQAIRSVVGSFKTLKHDWKYCPVRIVFDIVFELHQQELFVLLNPMIKDSQILCQLLKASTYNVHFYQSRSEIRTPNIV